jgi:hypothetical protein
MCLLGSMGRVTLQTLLGGADAVGRRGVLWSWQQWDARQSSLSRHSACTSLNCITLVAAVAKWRVCLEFQGTHRISWVDWATLDHCPD